MTMPPMTTPSKRIIIDSMLLVSAHRFTGHRGRDRPAAGGPPGGGPEASGHGVGAVQPGPVDLL